MIDRAARDQARALVLAWRDGAISNDDFVDAWPRSRGDAALGAIATMLWSSYDDRREHRLTGADGPSPSERDLMTRCALFLESDLAYAWRQRDFMRIAGLGPLTYLSLGLLWPLDWWIRRSNRRFEAGLAASGDFAVWPFRTHDDFEPWARRFESLRATGQGDHG